MIQRLDDFRGSAENLRGRAAVAMHKDVHQRVLGALLAAQPIKRIHSAPRR
jgi:hypothetical protein